MAKLAVLAAFYRRPWAVPAIAKALREQTRPPDETWLLWEDPEDCRALASEEWPGRVFLRHTPTPRDEDGFPTLAPPSIAYNAALDETDADFIVYLADDSLPLPDKFARMTARLEAGAGAVFCAQDYGYVQTPEDWLAAIGTSGSVRAANEPQASPYCKVDLSQVMHRRTSARWPTAMNTIRATDGYFFEDLVREFGPLDPIPDVLDWTRLLPDGVSARF